MADYTKDEEIAIIHADAYEDAVAFRNDLIETYPQFKDTKISIMQLGPVIGSHVGPDFMAITYHGKHRLNIEK
jgi:EDD domain protein, degV family